MNLPIGTQNKPLAGQEFGQNVTELKIKTKIKKKYTYTQDPGHGWVSVPHEDIVATGIKDLISPFSFINSTRVFLEEDGDLKLFMDAAKIIGWDIELKDSVVDKTSIRSYAPYNVEWINEPFEIGRTVYLLDGTELAVTEKIKTGFLLNNEAKQFRVPRLNPMGRIYPSNPTIQKEEQVG